MRHGKILVYEEIMMTKVFIEVEWFVNEDEEKEVVFVNYIALNKYTDVYQDECELLVDEYLQSFGTQNVNSYYRSVLEAHITFHKDYWGEVDVDFDWKQLYHTEIQVKNTNQDSGFTILRG